LKQITRIFRLEEALSSLALDFLQSTKMTQFYRRNPFDIQNLGLLTESVKVGPRQTGVSIKEIGSLGGRTCEQGLYF